MLLHMSSRHRSGVLPRRTAGGEVAADRPWDEANILQLGN